MGILYKRIEIRRLNVGQRARPKGLNASRRQRLGSMKGKRTGIRRRWSELHDAMRCIPTTRHLRFFDASL
jgi:hypothetical protein